MTNVFDLLGVIVLFVIVYCLNLSVGKSGVAGKLSTGFALFQTLVVFASAGGAIILLGDLVKNEAVSLFLAVFGLSGVLLLSGFMSFKYYQQRILAHPEEFYIQDGSVVFEKSYLFGGVVSYLGFGILAAGIGLANTISVVIGDRHGVLYGLAILNGAALGQTMYDKTAKYNVLGRLGSALGLSSPLIISGLILVIFYRFRVVKYPKEFMIVGNDIEISGSYLLSGAITLLWFGLMLEGIGMMGYVQALIGGKTGFFYASLALIPVVIAIWLITQYRKWMFKYIVWVLRRKGLLQVVDESKSKDID